MSKARKRYSYIDEWKSLWEPDLKAIAYDGNTIDPTKVDSKVLQWVKDNCAQKPHSVKLINSTAAHGRARHDSSIRYFSMSVPNLFAQENFKELERVVTLENADGRTWKVLFGTTPRKHPMWRQGWERVAKDNNLKPGDVMVFVLVRNSRFHFTVFDKDGNMSTERSTSSLNGAIVKREPSCSSRSHQELSTSTPALEHRKTRKRLFKSKKEAHEIAEASWNFEFAGYRSEQLTTKKTEWTSRGKIVKRMATKEEKPCGARSGNSRHSSPVPTVLHKKSPQSESVDPFAFSIKSRRRCTTELENQRAWDAAMAHANILSRLHFISVMSETQVYRDFHLVLPDCFVAESSFPTIAARWRLLDSDGNSWDMYSMKNKRNNVTLHRKHWAQFSLHHFLEDGNVCVFEIKEDDALALVVHIFRVLPISIADKISVHAHYGMHEINTT